MTDNDVVDFLAATAEAFPEARFFNFRPLRKKGRIEEIPRDSPKLRTRPPWFIDIQIFFFGPSWQPEFVAIDDRRSVYTVQNLPRLRASISPGTFGGTVWDELGREITSGHSGNLNANHHADDADGKRIIDKLFRVHRKLVEKRLVIIDLVTGAVVGEDEGYKWYGADAARQCLANEDQYIQVLYSPETSTFWGCKPAKVPGE